MGTNNFLPLALGLILFSFLITSTLVVPFIDFLYKIKFTRKTEAPKTGKVPLFDKLHDRKAGTPVGGGVLIIAIVTILFTILFPISRYLGVYIQTAYNLRIELFIIFFRSSRFLFIIPGSAKSIEIFTLFLFAISIILSTSAGFPRVCAKIIPLFTNSGKIFIL